MNPSKGSLRALDWLNIFLADIRYGVSGFLPVYLLSVHHWNAEQIGIALSIPGITAILFQSPAGALVDEIKHKRHLIIAACILLAACCFGLILFSTPIPIYSIQGIIGVITTIYTPAITAITLGLVGNRIFPKRMGRNETFNHTGNVIITIAAGLIGYYISYHGIFYLMIMMCLLSITATLFIKDKEIDHAVAREANEIEGKESIISIKVLFKDKIIIFYTIAVVLFYFSNAAMYPILTQYLAKGRESVATIYTAAGITIAEFVMIPTAAITGYAAAKGNRKYLFLIAFIILPIRGLLYTLFEDPYHLLAIQLLDGLGAGIVKVISVIMIADLTIGTGRFNFMQGTVATAIGIGTALSDVVTGTIVNTLGFHAAFYFLSFIAIIGLLFFLFLVPETKNIRGRTVTDEER